jgi:hypothetical protein
MTVAGADALRLLDGRLSPAGGVQPPGRLGMRKT